MKTFYYILEKCQYSSLSLYYLIVVLHTNERENFFCLFLYVCTNISSTEKRNFSAPIFSRGFFFDSRYRSLSRKFIPNVYFHLYRYITARRTQTAYFYKYKSKIISIKIIKRVRFDLFLSQESSDPVR